MSSTYYSGRAVFKMNDDPDPFVLIATETCESNCFPQIPKFCCNYFMRLSKAVTRLISDAESFEGGGARGAKGKAMLPEAELSAWNNAFKEPYVWFGIMLEVPLICPYAYAVERAAATERKAHIEQVCAKFSFVPKFVENSRIFAESHFEFDVRESGCWDVLNELFNVSPAIPTGQYPGRFLSPWNVFDFVHTQHRAPAITLPECTEQPAVASFVSVEVSFPEYASLTDVKTCVVVDGVIVSNDAVWWLCNSAPAPRRGSNQFLDTAYALKQYRIQREHMPVFKAEQLGLIANPISEDQARKMSVYTIDKLVKYELGTEAKELTASNAWVALDALGEGLVISVSPDNLAAASNKTNQQALAW